MHFHNLNNRIMTILKPAGEINEVHVTKRIPISVEQSGDIVSITLSQSLYEEEKITFNPLEPQGAMPLIYITPPVWRPGERCFPSVL
jgi:iron-sulfur cluster repair protein YtfE (RIC family)